MWPYTLPAVRAILDGGLDLDPGVTVLVGENGSGKSTVVEAIAAAWARRVTAFRSDIVQQVVGSPAAEDSDLHRALQLHYTLGGANGGLCLRAERLHEQADVLTAPNSTWQRRLGPGSILARSHGRDSRTCWAP